MSVQIHPEAPNFRSLCGIGLPDGRRVREGRFYRCASPHTFSPAALEALEALDPYAVVDLRGVAEAEAAWYELPGGIRDRRVAMPVEPKTGDRVRALHAEGKLTAETAREAMRETYRYYAEESAAVFREFMQLAAEAEGRPIVWHCAAGKDRTGFGAALILSALGASREEIERDYLVSNDLWRPSSTATVSTLPEVAQVALKRVEAAYLEAAFEAMERSHGSALAYATDALGGEEKRAAFVRSAVS